MTVQQMHSSNMGIFAIPTCSKWIDWTARLRMMLTKSPKSIITRGDSMLQYAIRCMHIRPHTHRKAQFLIHRRLISIITGTIVLRTPVWTVADASHFILFTQLWKYPTMPLSNRVSILLSNAILRNRTWNKHAMFEQLIAGKFCAFPN